MTEDVPKQPDRQEIKVPGEWAVSWEMVKTLDEESLRELIGRINDRQAALYRGLIVLGQALGPEVASRLVAELDLSGAHAPEPPIPSPSA